MALLTRSEAIRQFMEAIRLADETCKQARTEALKTFEESPGTEEFFNTLPADLIALRGEPRAAAYVTTRICDLIHQTLCLKGWTLYP